MDRWLEGLDLCTYGYNPFYPGVYTQGLVTQGLDLKDLGDLHTGVLKGLTYVLMGTTPSTPGFILKGLLLKGLT
jgi:hypothetical protein